MAFRVLLHPKAGLRALEDDPVTRRSGVDIKRLDGTRGREELFRLRAGTHRAVYSVSGDEILVTDLFGRGRGYDV